MSSSRGKLFVISGPSGSGKSSICRRVSEKTGVPCSVSATTRPPRPGEQDGVHYLFLSPEEFASRASAGWFYEHAEVYGHRYGTPGTPIETALDEGNCLLLDIDVQGGKSVKERCRDAILIFIAASDDEELRRRLEKRGTESEQEMQLRLSKAAEESERRKHYDHVVVNDDLEKTVEEVIRIIGEEKENG